MAIIYSYPDIPELDGRDLLIISDVSVRTKPTKKVTLDNLSNFVIDKAKDTFVPLTREITINGVTQNLEDDRTWTIDSDKAFVFTQATPANPWVINHNLDKFPSVTMTLSTGQTGIADVTYIDRNNLTITFSGDESGKAYMN